MMLTIALAQLKVTSFDKELNLSRAIAAIRHCREKQADYVLFPELFLTGYFIAERIAELSEPVDGESIQRLQQAVREIGVGIIIGFPEVSEGRYYNSAVFIEKDGQIKGVYRKVHLFDKERGFFTPGDDCPVMETACGARIGLMMTYDVEFPEMARVYAVNGAQVLLVLNAHNVPFEPHQELFLRARGLENQLFVAAANTVGLQETTLFFGESAVISPDGNFLAKGGNNEEIIVATLDLQEPERVRAQQPMKYLAERRSDVYKAHKLLP
ncbi:MAG: carbon-nitrogen hydrolase family protein [Clostridia bacterium]